jgi:hypothetical protein
VNLDGDNNSQSARELKEHGELAHAHLSLVATHFLLKHCNQILFFFGKPRCTAGLRMHTIHVQQLNCSLR